MSLQASFQKRRLDGARLFVANLAQAEHDVMMHQRSCSSFGDHMVSLVDCTNFKFGIGERLVKTRSQYHPDVGSPEEGQARGSAVFVLRKESTVGFSPAIS